MKTSRKKHSEANFTYLQLIVELNWDSLWSWKSIVGWYLVLAWNLNRKPVDRIRQLPSTVIFNRGVDTLYKEQLARFTHKVFTYISNRRKVCYRYLRDTSCRDLKWQPSWSDAHGHSAMPSIVSVWIIWLKASAQSTKA